MARAKDMGILSNRISEMDDCELGRQIEGFIENRCPSHPANKREAQTYAREAMQRSGWPMRGNETHSEYECRQANYSAWIYDLMMWATA